MKFDIFEKSLSGELAFFELVSKDETRSDPAHPGFALQAGEVTSEGFDLDVGITLSENWQMMAGLGYVDSYVSADPNPNRIGLKQASIPEWSAGIWSKYSFSEGGLKGLGLGIGYIFRDDYFGGDEDFVVPSYDIFNLLVDYSWEKFRIALNVDNLFDEEYNVYQASARFGQPGLPRWAKLTVSREW